MVHNVLFQKRTPLLPEKQKRRVEISVHNSRGVVSGHVAVRAWYQEVMGGNKLLVAGNVAVTCGHVETNVESDLQLLGT